MHHYFRPRLELSGLLEEGCMLDLGRLCLKLHLLFNYFIPQNEPIILFKLPIIPVIIPVFVFYRCRIGHRIVKLQPCPQALPSYSLLALRSWCN